MALAFLGRRSWRPWALSLAVDMASRFLIGSTRNLNEQEKDEVARRTVLWLYYFLRSPFFETLLRYAYHAAHSPAQSRSRTVAVC